MPKISLLHAIFQFFYNVTPFLLNFTWNSRFYVYWYEKFWKDLDSCLGRPTMEWNTALGPLSPANPSLDIPDPLSKTKAATSLSPITVPFLWYYSLLQSKNFIWIQILSFEIPYIVTTGQSIQITAYGWNYESEISCCSRMIMHRRQKIYFFA